jgi:hypothetical protein
MYMLFAIFQTFIFSFAIFSGANIFTIMLSAFTLVMLWLVVYLDTSYWN